MARDAPNWVLLRRNIAMDYSDATAAKDRGARTARMVRRSETADWARSLDIV